MCTLANSEDPDEMPHCAAFHQGLHYLLTQSGSSKREKQYFLEIITCDPSIYTMNHPLFIVCSFMENSIGPERVQHQPLTNSKSFFLKMSLHRLTCTLYKYSSLKTNI